MPYVFTTGFLPYNQGTEVAKIYVETIKEYRSSIRGLSKEIIPNAVKARKDYIEVTGVHDVKEGNLKELLLAEQKYMTKFHDIKGYSYTVEVRFKVGEALEMIGMKMPE
ncbi:MAG: hypothetical protein ACFE8A_05605 [Candidatus Hodarchaeota archaeon]